MAVSPSGVGTLLFLIFVGPAIYLLKWLYKEYVKRDHAEKPNVNYDSVTEQENLSTKAYLFALVGYAIGIGNIWRFPYVIASNGGAAAVVAYLICAVLVAWPLFIYELIVGQYVRLTFVKTWEAIRPRWLSFGWAQFLLLFICQTYFSMVIAYTLPYIAGSCQEPLPWTGETTSQEHWEKDILNKYDDMRDKPPGPGPIQWELAVSLLVFWIITYVSIAFGKNILAQVTYVTVILPVVLMLVLVIVTVQQPGAAEGIKFYIGKFEASELAKLDVWATALGQILFSLSPGFGTAITYSSFAARNEDVYRVGFIVAIANSAFSLIGGIAVFSIVGYLAEKEGLTVEEVATRGGQGLAFITIASAMPFFGAAQNVMSVLFYVMLLTLGLDSSYAWTETIVSSVDEVLHARGIKRPFWQVSLVLCTVMFLLGLVFTTRMGGQILDVIDMFVGTIFLLAACFIESIIFNIDLDWRRVSLALKAATKGNRRFPDGRNLFPRFLCRIDYHLTVPLATGLLFIYIFVDVASKPYGDYPTSLLAWGWTLLSLLLATSLLTVWKRDPSKLPAIEDDPKLQPVLNPDSVAFKGEDSSANELELAEGENPADAGFQEEPAQEAISQEAPSQEAPSQEAPSQEGLAGDSTKEDGSSNV